MDNPIYGDEHSTLQKVLFYSAAAIILLVSGITITLLIIFTFIKNGHWPHLLFATAIVAIMVPGIIMLIFHKRDDGTMDSKLKIVTISIWVVVLFACVVGICYVFGLTFPGKKCEAKGYLSGHDKDKPYGYMYRYTDGQCFHPIPCMAKPNACVAWSHDGSPYCGSFNFTTSICNSIYPI